MTENKKKTNRKNFIKQSGLAAVTALGGASVLDCRRKGSNSSSSAASIHLSKKSFEWTMVTTWPRNFPGLGTGANRLAKRITSMSAGRLKVNVSAAGERVPALQVFDTVRSGSAQLGHGASYYWKGKIHAAQFFSAVPFGLNAQEMSAWLRYAGAQKLWTRLYQPFGLKPFPCGNTGVQMGGWFNKQINSVQDFKGLVMRMPGLGGEVIRELGAAAPNIPGGELFQSLQSGVIDATEWVGPYNDLAFGFYKAAKYYYWPGWHEPGTVLELIVNLEAFNSLPSDLKQIVEFACLADYNEMLAEFNARNNAALRVLVEKRNVKLRKFPDEVLQKLGEVSLDVVHSAGNRNRDSRKIYESYKNFRKDATEWSRIGEQGFFLARSLSENIQR